MQATPQTLDALLKALNIPLPEGADGTLVIQAVKSLSDAGEGDLSFLDNPKYAASAKTTKANAVFIHPDQADSLPESAQAIPTSMPYVAFAQSLAILYPQERQSGIHPTATIHETATVDTTAYVGAHSVIGEGVTIGARTQIGNNVSIQQTTIGTDGIIHSGVRIGQDGFGFAEFSGQIVKIPQVGSVKIGDHVEIGANSCIDRGALGETTLGNHVKLDNLVQIGHNAMIGDNVRICGQSGIAGSASLGEGCLIGAQSGVSGHITIAPNTTLAAKSALVKEVKEEGQTFAGFPAIPHKDWLKQQARLAKLLKSK